MPTRPQRRYNNCLLTISVNRLDMHQNRRNNLVLVLDCRHIWYRWYIQDICIIWYRWYLQDICIIWYRWYIQVARDTWYLLGGVEHCLYGPRGHVSLRLANMKWADLDPLASILRTKIKHKKKQFVVYLQFLMWIGCFILSTSNTFFYDLLYIRKFNSQN
jgi:hypothetical protein